MEKAYRKWQSQCTCHIPISSIYIYASILSFISDQKEVNINCNKRKETSIETGKELTRTYRWAILRVIIFQRNKLGIFNQLGRSPCSAIQVIYKRNNTRRKYGYSENITCKENHFGTI